MTDVEAKIADVAAAPAAGDAPAPAKKKKASSSLFSFGFTKKAKGADETPYRNPNLPKELGTLRKTAIKPWAPEKKRKAEDGPTGPKKPLTAFFHFCAEMRPAVNAEIAAGTLKQGTDAAAVTKVLGERWSALDAEAKKKYEDLANKDKERYAAECKEAGIETAEEKKAKRDAEKEEKKAMAAQERALKAAEKAEEKKAKAAQRAKEKEAREAERAARARIPKKLSALQLYQEAEHDTVAAENPSLSKKEVKAMLADQFKKMSDGEKKPYQDESKDRADKYNAYIKEHPEYAPKKAGSSPRSPAAADTTKSSATSAAKQEDAVKAQQVDGNDGVAAMEGEANADAEMEAAEKEELERLAKKLSPPGSPDCTWLYKLTARLKGVELGELLGGQTLERFWLQLLDLDVDMMQAGLQQVIESGAPKEVVECIGEIVERKKLYPPNVVPMDEDQAGKDDDKPETAFSQKLLAVNSDAEPTVEQENKSMSVDTQPVDAQAETQADDDEPSATETAPASQGTGSPTWIESWVCEAEKVPGLSTMMPNGVRTNLKTVAGFSTEEAEAGLENFQTGAAGAEGDDKLPFEFLAKFCQAKLDQDMQAPLIAKLSGFDPSVLANLGADSPEQFIGNLLDCDVEQLEGGREGMKAAQADDSTGLFAYVADTVVPKLIERRLKLDGNK